MTEAAPQELSQTELDALREIHISVDLKGLKKAWKKIFHDAPFKLYQDTAIRIEDFSRKLMTGKASLFSMPLGIILRNTSRAAYNSAEGKYYHLSSVIGVVAAIGAVGGAVMVGAPILAAAFGAPLVASIVGATIAGALTTWGAYVVAAAIAAPVLPIPAYTAATLTASTVVAAAVATFSTLLAAPANFFVAWRRSKASLNGVKLTEEDIEKLQTEFDRESPSAKRQRDLTATVHNNLSYLPPAEKKKIFASLKTEFDDATAEAAAPTAAATTAPKPTAK